MYHEYIYGRSQFLIYNVISGHTHLDEFEVSYSDYNQRNADSAVAVSYVGPSMTPTSGNPAFRVYDVDPVTFGILDVTTYIANMSDPEFQSEKGPVWTKYYSAREAYGSLVDPPIAPLGTDGNGSEEEGKGGRRELDPAFWHEVTEMLEGDPAAFDQFMARKRRGWGAEVCDDDCKAMEICKLRAGRAQDNCIPPGFIRLPRKGPTGEVPPATTGLGEHECGGSVVADMFGALARDAEMRVWFETSMISEL